MSQEFQSLDEALGEVKKDRQGDSGHTKRSERQRINITLPPPKRTCQMYGYCVPYKWLYEKGIFLFAKAHPDLPADEAGNDVDPLYSFSTYFGIDSLGVRSAIVPLAQTVPADCIEDGFVSVLYIFNDQPDNYRWRPTQKQVDELTKFMSREPQWWVGHLPGSYFE
ncbi:hypothetical protein F4604DRAFT_1048905 [Suillus subluteus]|nr:hypothetical protein F4604DRAFT_1048905 [Suillus subluteus]